ncbi:MAG TPA: hypothetical protein VFS43_01640 [Polyangiaceae bacterium]|nr:hypothetical protein [Polyangiaceae bacterium]
MADETARRAERYVRAGARLTRGRSSRDLRILAADELARGGADWRAGLGARADRRLALAGVLRVLAGDSEASTEAGLRLMSGHAAEALRVALRRAGARLRRPPAGEVAGRPSSGALRPSGR